MKEQEKIIRSLSIKDKKTLSQKTLKLVEEIGELSRVILPFDYADGTGHIFVDREKILEEIIDVYLTNISIAYSLDFSEKEMEEMMDRKIKKWSMLQSKNDEATFPLPYEIHISVDNTDINNDKFIEDCKSIGVKPIVLDLEIADSKPIKDIMTSSKHYGDNRSSYEETRTIANNLEQLGYKVVRRKIESVPWHPAAPTINTGEPIPNSCYFESHIGITILPDEKPGLQYLVNEINEGCTRDGIHNINGSTKLSQNFFKRSKDGSKFVNMLTYRDNMTCRSNFERDVETIKSLLKSHNFEFEKVEVEYAIYDTNINHDSKWITG